MSEMSKGPDKGTGNRSLDSIDGMLLAYSSSSIVPHSPTNASVRLNPNAVPFAVGNVGNTTSISSNSNNNAGYVVASCDSSKNNKSNKKRRNRKPRDAREREPVRDNSNQSIYAPVVTRVPMPKPQSQRPQSTSQETNTPKQNSEEKYDQIPDTNNSGSSVSAAANVAVPARSANTSKQYSPVPISLGQSRHAKRIQALEKERQDLDLAAKLAAQLKVGSYECMVCYDLVRARDQIWSCSKSCFAVFHAKCVRVWANSSASGSATSLIEGRPEWRCPGCQFKYSEHPYPSCFCGKTDSPVSSRNLNMIPHSCGDQCLKVRPCSHKCTAVCHPGPCEKCQLLAPEMECYCGKIVHKFRCADVEDIMDISCNQTCGKTLNCGKHFCSAICHDGPCFVCTEEIDVDCQCSKCTTSVACGSAFTGISGEIFQCNEFCGAPFPCGYHTCDKICHIHDNNSLCATDPCFVKSCPCGAETIENLLGGSKRQSCEDPIPVCGNTCAKTFKCGHICTAQCHIGECNGCTYKVSLPCRCGKSSFSLECKSIALEIDGTYQTQICDRVCTMKRSCKKHLCGNICCPADRAAHFCEQQCEKLLKNQCGTHKCQMACGHSERCHDCFEGVSFEELTCTCGSEVIYPPVPCGTAPPRCDRPCRFSLPCGHMPYSTHPCHPASEPCPKCMIFVDRECACGKTVMSNIACSRTVIPNCGKPCMKPLAGCLHPCKRSCHLGDCVDGLNKCVEKCNRIRPLCGHVCTFGCHGKNFCAEDKPCSQRVTEQCPCGNKVGKFTCGAWKENIGRNISQMQCDDSCVVAKRNRAFAEALDINVGVNKAIDSIDSSSPSNINGSSNAVILEPLDCQLNLIKYAYVNVIWVRTIEKVLADFVTDKDRNTHHHMISKPASIKFIVTLAPYYGLDSEVVDVSWGNAKTSVILRKRVRNGWCGIPNVALSSIAQHYRALASVAEANGGIPVTGAYNAIIAGNTGSVGDIPHDSDNSEGQNLADFNPPSASTEVPLSLPPVSSVKIAVNGYQITNLSRALEDRDLVDLLEPILKLPVSITWLEISDTRNDCVIQLVETENMSQVEYILVNSSNKVFNLLVMDGLAEDVELCWMTHKQVITATAEIHTKKPAKSFKRPAQTKKDSIGHESKFSALKYDFPDE